ncbi:MAG TPA: hypothetical protein VGF97_03980 [Rhizomicrobium sp.]|jgi:hypothetical protein
MLDWLKAAAALTAVVTLGGAGAYTNAVPRTALAHIKSIGLIVSVGDTCMFEHTKPSALEWAAPPEASFLEISDWQIDDHVAQEVTTLLAARFQIQVVPFEHQAFDNWTYAQLSRRIREMPEPDEPVDAYLVILRDWRPDVLGPSRQEVGGLGLYRRGNSRPNLFASYRIALLDAQDGRLIATRPALSPSGDTPASLAPFGTWPRTQNELSVAQGEILKTGLTSLVDQTLVSTLNQLLPGAAVHTK